MSLRLAMMGLIVMIVVAACQSSQTEYLLEVTREVTVEVIITATPNDSDGAVVAPADTAPAATNVPPPTQPATAAPASPTPDVFPTTTQDQIIVSEQIFERGRMFYLAPIDLIWVLVYDDDNQLSGTWETYPDTFDENAPEVTPDVTPPNGLFVPERGFGNVWLENDDVQSALGFALEPEQGHVTQYEYVPGGEVINGQYVAGPGTHLLNSRYGGTFIFDEATGTWGVAATQN